MAEDEEQPKRRRAVALQYAEGDRAPKVIATGAGILAERIIELAAENDIPIREDDDLVEVLSRLDIGYEIPPETFQVVAEILSFLYRTDEKWRKKKKGQHPAFNRLEATLGPGEKPEDANE